MYNQPTPDMLESNIPILVGVGQITDHPQNEEGRTPLELMVSSAQKAVSDAGASGLVNAITDVSACGLTVDADLVKTPFKKAYDNVPKLVANQLGIEASRYYYAAPGGNTPQYLVNYHARRIIEGHDETVLLVAGEALHNMFQRFTPWYKLFTPWKGWRGKTGSTPLSIGDNRPGSTPHEDQYKLTLPSKVYPLFENALQAHYGRSASDHHQHIGKLFGKINKIASNNPYAWFQTPRSSEELITQTDKNRMIAYPYTKYLNSIIKVNQSASVILTNVAQARKLGISSDKWVYLSGFADQNDHWYVSQRENYHSSPAIRSAGKRALQMAHKSIDDLEFFDLYSCFPSAVQIACDELSIAHDDTRDLSLTGGLPYFGGPGNGYAMHAIVEMVNRLRESNSNSSGLVNANGWYLTKHSFGVYSNSAPTSYDLNLAGQRDLSKEKVPTFNENPKGKAKIETFTVIYGKGNVPKSTVIIGRDSDNKRFISQGPTDAESVAMMQGEQSIVGRQGHVFKARKKNRFEFES